MGNAPATIKVRMLGTPYGDAVMKEIVATITGKRQVTISSEVRRHLGVVPSDKIAFVLRDEGTVELRPPRYTAASLSGIMPALPGGETDDLEVEIAEAMDAMADRLIREMGGL